MIAVPAPKRRRLTPSNTSDEESSPSTLVAQPDELSSNSFVTNPTRWNLEQDYEQKPRKKNKKEKENSRLPIKTADGRIEQLEVLEIQEDDNGSPGGSEDADEQAEHEPVGIKEEVPHVPIRQQIIEAKEELARVAILISEDPEEHAGGFRTLGQIASSSDPTIKRLGLVTQLAVFKDVIPGYRIRPIAESDMAEKLSKDVRRLRAFEQALVSSYQKYVRELTKVAKLGNRGEPEGTTGISDVAYSCACTLILAVPHFNFRGELLKILINKLSGKKIDSSFIKCRETIENLFQNDEDGTASLDAVTILTRMMKARDYQVDEGVLNTFLHLRLLSEFSSKGSQTQIDKPTPSPSLNGKKPKVKKEFRTKKQRKILKERKVVEKEFKEAEAIVTHEERDQKQAETLKLVFITYFRILKDRSPKLMGAVLEGLAKYAHLINQDFFGDLLEALKDLISHADTLLNTSFSSDDDDETQKPTTKPPPQSPTASNPTRSSLLCIITAFALLSGQDAARSASALHLDLTFFTTHLYNSLHLLSLSPDLELSSKTPRLPSPTYHPTPTPTPPKKIINHTTTTVLLLRALTTTLTPRTTPPIRLAAFTKKLLTCALQLPEKSSLATLTLLTTIAKSQGRKISALWNTEERRGDGVFDAVGAGGEGGGGGGSVEGSNPFASTIWEGELLRLHFCPGVREGVEGLEKGVGGVGGGVS